MRSKRSKVRACACVTYFVTFSFTIMRFKGQIWIERNLFLFASCCFLFFFWSNALKKFRNLSRDDDDDDDDILIINKNSAISEEKILHLSFLSLSLF